MSRWRLFQFILLLPVFLLAGCGFDSTGTRVGVLVLVPFLLLVGVLWLLHRRPSGDEEDWESERFPDSDDDDDNENHYLM